MPATQRPDLDVVASRKVSRTTQTQFPSAESTSRLGQPSFPIPFGDSHFRDPIEAFSIAISRLRKSLIPMPERQFASLQVADPFGLASLHACELVLAHRLGDFTTM